MRAVVQRVSGAQVSTSEGGEISRIGKGLVVLLGVAQGDSTEDADYLASKIAHLRIFEDDAGKMNLSLREVGGEMLVVSQFTLLADTRKGRRPSFVAAAPPDKARQLYEHFIGQAGSLGIKAVGGEFQALMAVKLVNWGPVTIILDSKAH